MDVSQFGLFDLTCRQPRWTGQPIAAPDERILPLGPVRRGVANDNIKHAGGQPRRSAQAISLRPYRSLFRLMLLRGTEHGQA